MITSTQSVGVFKDSPQLVTIQCESRRGIPGISVVGLPSSYSTQLLHRIYPALRSIGIRPKKLAFTIQITPHCNQFLPNLDLAILVVLLKHHRTVAKWLETSILIAKLDVTGQTFRPTNQTQLVSFAASISQQHIITSQLSHNTASLQISNLSSVSHLSQLMSEQHLTPNVKFSAPPSQPSWGEISGYLPEKELLMIAIAGQHHMMLFGPAGVGKSQLLEHATSFIPNLSVRAQRQLALHSQLDPEEKIWRPRVSTPHTTHTPSSFFNKTLPKSMSGVVIMHEFTNFSSKIRYGLHQALDSSNRNWLLWGSANPCPCGYWGSSNACTCKPHQVERQLSKFTSSLQDRIDIWHHVELKTTQQQQTSPHQAMRQVHKIQKVQSRLKILPNPQKMLTANATTVLEKAQQTLPLSHRKTKQIAQLSKTISVWHGQESISPDAIYQALSYVPTLPTHH